MARICCRTWTAAARRHRDIFRPRKLAGPAARASQTHSADWAAAWRMYLSWLLRGVAAEASCDPGPVGVALMSGNVLQLAANGFLFDLYLDPAQNFSGKAFALTSDGSGDYFMPLARRSSAPTPLSFPPARAAAASTSSAAGPSWCCQAEPPSRRPFEIVSSDIRRRTGRVRHRRRRHRLRRIASDRRRRHREQHHDCERRHARRLRRRLG
jgi:hypothetical protein